MVVTMKNLPFFFVLAAVVSLSSGYKILFLAPMNGISHFLYMSSFVKALIGRGHHVAFLTSNSLSHLNLPNYTEVLIDPKLDISSIVPQEVFLNMASGSVFSSINDLHKFANFWNTYALENSNVQKFIHSNGLHFDLVINEEFFADSFLMFAHKFKAPIVTICSLGVTEFIDREQGLFPPPSIVPHWRLAFSDNMSLYERWFNTIVSAYDWMVRRFSYLPTEEEYTRKYFAHLAPLPSLDDLLRNVSLILVNTHRALSPPRPAMPSVISIGGAHIESAKPLPTDIKIFIEDAKNGVIYFSLGTVLQSSELPKELIKSFFDAFRNIKQRVLWKFEDESLADVPPNVMIRKWLPQNDILAHPNVLLFISHGGLFGTSESLYHGVPLLLIPFFGDQFRNAYMVKEAGYGNFMFYREITEDSFSKAITDIVSNESYINKARQTSTIFKDNLVHPMEEAMFWIEYVCRFKGAKHLKSQAVYMTWFSYLLLDVFLVNVLIVLAAFYWIKFGIHLFVKILRLKNISYKKQQ